MLTAPDDSDMHWVKSTRSAANGACVEVAFVAAGAVAVRDSKDPDGPVLRFAAEAWRGFIESVQAGRFDTGS
jgi:ABC-type amino acid transport substrate-binding protein